MQLYDVVTVELDYNIRRRIEARVPGALAIKIAKRWNLQYGSEVRVAIVEVAQ